MAVGEQDAVKESIRKCGMLAPAGAIGVKLGG